MKRVATLVLVGLVSAVFLGGCCGKRCGHHHKCEPKCESRCGEYRAVKREYGCK